MRAGILARTHEKASQLVIFVKGDIFQSPAQVLTNTVNCVGVMGKGLALEFKNRFPQLFRDYKQKCKKGQVVPGKPYLWEDESTQILNFPTKRHWCDNSLLQDIEDGLKYLASSYEQKSIQSIAMPALGCGLGELKWTDVKPLIEKHLGGIPDLDVYVYEPQSASVIKTTYDKKKSYIESGKEKISALPQEI
jgi:O-acetyl-ADP-ribose deacetylase (regulator of RNase III)